MKFIQNYRVFESKSFSEEDIQDLFINLIDEGHKIDINMDTLIVPYKYMDSTNIYKKGFFRPINSRTGEHATTDKNGIKCTLVRIWVRFDGSEDRFQTDKLIISKIQKYESRFDTLYNLNLYGICVHGYYGGHRYEVALLPNNI